MSDILNHPQLKDLEPQNAREGLLYAKAYITAIEATIKTVEKFGLDPAREMHEKIMAELAVKVEGGAND